MQGRHTHRSWGGHIPPLFYTVGVRGVHKFMTANPNTCLQSCNVVFSASRHSQSRVAGHAGHLSPSSFASVGDMPEKELIEPDEIENIHDAVIVNGIDL